MEKILAIFESQQDSPKVIVSSESSKKFRTKRESDVDAEVKSQRPETSPPEYDFYITDSRFICAVVWDEETDVPDDSSLPYDVLVQQSYAPVKQQRRTSYQRSTPDEIMEMHPKSMSIPFDEVDWVRVKKGFFGAHVEISAPAKDKKPFKMPIDKKRYDEAKSILEGRLGTKLK